ncbi:transamidase GatB domain protein [Acetivibrio straminisolvens JCM 21531]|uniref:Transamidase GatB domain protein n=1 Tax=Acetivibrio straminisolvens JCM 21531 TaxID=1294263 RepID=W4V9Q9_9FIRM|nr:transamidase GatB domain protein [Acetivibrio straminisolvens JCM 21531]
MPLKEKLMDDLKAAMKDKDVTRKNAIQMVRSAVLQVEKDNKFTLDDDGILEIIAKEVKKRRDSLAEYEKSDRQDLIDA